MTHVPVLLNEVIRFLNPKTGNFIIDGTVDGGGHSAEIFPKISPGGILLGVDLDRKMIRRAKEKISANPKCSAKRTYLPAKQGFASGGKNQDSKLILTEGNYADLPEILKKDKLGKADGLLLDLGFSSEQLKSERGFSFLKDEPLLMTYNESQKPVKEILRELNEDALAEIIFRFSGEKFARRISKAIVSREKIRPIETSGELADIIGKALPPNYERGRINPATRTFQALRIYVNDELGNLETILQNLPEILKKGSRVVIMSFHSLEDALVKKCFKKMEKEHKIEILTKKPVIAGEKERQNNPRSRSAKLRAAILL